MPQIIQRAILIHGLSLIKLVSGRVRHVPLVQCSALLTIQCRFLHHRVTTRALQFWHRCSAMFPIFGEVRWKFCWRSLFKCPSMINLTDSSNGKAIVGTFNINKQGEAASRSFFYNYCVLNITGRNWRSLVTTLSVRCSADCSADHCEPHLTVLTR